MDLALNNLQRLICHKTETTDQPPSFGECGVDPSLPFLPGPFKPGVQAPN